MALSGRDFVGKPRLAQGRLSEYVDVFVQYYCYMYYPFYSTCYQVLFTSRIRKSYLEGTALLLVTVIE